MPNAKLSFLEKGREAKGEKKQNTRSSFKIDFLRLLLLLLCSEVQRRGRQTALPVRGRGC